MKRIITAAVLLIGATFSISSRASAQEAAVKVNVPFDFAVGARVLPAGIYIIAAHGDALDFESHDQKASMFVMANQGDEATNGQSKLVFDDVQGQYFLRKIVSTWAKTSVEFPISKLEKKSQKSQEIAQSRIVYAETSSR